MKNLNFLIVLSIILSGIMFMASDCEGTFDDTVTEIACPTITTGYEHQQQTRNAVFTPCSNNTSGANRFELQMTINGTTFTYDDDATLDNIPRDLEIPLKVTYVSSGEMIGLKIRAQGAPLAGGEHFQGCESDFINEQSKSAADNTDYCKIELEETLGESLTEDRQTILLVNDYIDYQEIHITINYAE